MSSNRVEINSLDHRDHDDRLARVEEALAADEIVDDDLRASLAGCSACAVEADALTRSVRRLRASAGMLALDATPPAALRSRVARAVRDPQRPAPDTTNRPRRSLAGRLFRPLAWATSGALVGAAALAVALTIGTAAPAAAAAFDLTGLELAPGASGVAELRPAAGGSVAMAVRLRGLPASRPGEFYELWWVGPDKRHVSCGTFRSDGSPLDLAFTSGVDIATTVLIEVTVEKDDGDPAPGPHVVQ